MSYVEYTDVLNYKTDYILVSRSKPSISMKEEYDEYFKIGYEIN